MDLLLDINVAVDACMGRQPWCRDVDLALAKCQLEGGRLWLYAGSVQTLEYVTLKELKVTLAGSLPQPTARQLAWQARSLLKAFSADKHWLAALASEGNVFDSTDPEDEQLIHALDRFPEGAIRLLTRDDALLSRHPDKTLSPEAYCQQKMQATQPIDFIDLKTQQDALRPQLETRIHRVLHHGQYILGPEVAELEQRLAEYTRARHCITVASGTEALLISLMALGVKTGDEVITTPFTFAATAEAIVLLRATPVFVDIEPDTCNIDAGKIEAAITPKTRAIMPVSLYGQPADMDEINAIAAKYSLPVIEDAAQSFGAEYKGRKSCNLSTIGCTSFFPSKPLGCYGDGGAIFTNNDTLAQICREIRVHGQSARYTHTRIGVGGRMDTLQCAVVLAKMERFEWEVEQRLRIGERYRHLFAVRGAPVDLLALRPDRSCVWGQFTIMVDDRDNVRQRLHAQGIPTAVHYPKPLHHQAAYAVYAGLNDCPNSLVAGSRVMSLPMSAYLDQADQIRLVNFLSPTNL
jgi:UDP-2-acetamido-2-deoxy-ribo-hexuluronate aminotransferase